MSKLFGSIAGGTKKAIAAAPTPVPETPPPTPVDTGAAQTAADTERRRTQKARGRASTLLTSPSGVTTAANIGTRALLGG